MKYLTARNRKAEAVFEYLEAEGGKVKALQDRPPEYPPGCTTIFSPGWEVDAAGETAGLWRTRRAGPLRLLQELLLAGASAGLLEQQPRLHSGCASAAQDFRKIDLVFP